MVAQVARVVYGDTNGIYAFQAFTSLILFLAANTSIAAFPRWRVLAPTASSRPVRSRRRLAFSMGILLLGSSPPPGSPSPAAGRTP